MEASEPLHDLEPLGERTVPSYRICLAPSTCVAQTLAKCVCAAGQTRKIEFQQNEVLSRIVQLGGENTEGSEPDWSFWNGKSFFPKENGASEGPDGKTYRATFAIEECPPTEYDNENEYILEFRVENGCRCVYATYSDGTFWHYLNNAGSQLEQKVEITDVYKAFKVTVELEELRMDEVLEISSTGEAGIAWKDLMGIYRMLPANAGMPYGNNPVWKMISKEHRLGVNWENRWVILANNQEVIRNMASPSPLSPTGLQTKWMYWDVSTGTWKEDQQFKINSTACFPW